MYVRWKKRKSVNDDLIFDAVLVKSQREGGKVKQKFIKHLGSIPENADRNSQIYFWVNFFNKLDFLEGFTATEELKIIYDIEKRIPPITDEEIEKMCLF